jgi:hypothetical protein
MKIQEENCNMVLLTVVAVASAFVAVIANWWDGPQTASTKPPVYLAEQTPVHVVGALRAERQSTRPPVAADPAPSTDHPRLPSICTPQCLKRQPE